MAWTDEEIAFAARSWNRGLTAAAIATAFVDELGLERSAASILSLATRRRDLFAQRSKDMAGFVRDAVVAARARRARADIAALPGVEALPGPAKVLLDLERGDCRFPVASSGAATLFCAEAVDEWMPGFVGGCYCARHRDVTQQARAA